MKDKWKIIVPIIIVAALAAAFFLQGDGPEEMPLPENISAQQSENGATESADAETLSDEANIAEEPGGVQEAADTSETEVSESVPEQLPVENDADGQSSSAETPAAAETLIENTQQTSSSEAQENAPSSETAETNAVPGNAPQENPAAAENSETAEPAVSEEPAPQEPAPMEVTISISCATINNNLADLDSAKTGLVPADGWLLKELTVEFNEGESVFNVLQRVCKQNKIHMEFSNTPVYNSAYIEGIGNLYEFDCGPLSGWMYSVNGWYPNYGCSRYVLKDGDVICWRYTCDLGADIGGGFLDGFQKDE